MRFYHKYAKPAGVLSMFLIAALIVTSLFPREGKFRYEFQSGRPWLHETLIAPFSFPIYKPAIELKKEQDSILKLFVPYFSIDTTVVLYAKEEFITKIEILWEDFRNHQGETNQSIEQIEFYRETYTNFIKGILDKIYNTAIIESVEIADNILAENGPIMVMKANIVQRQEIRSVFTQKTAYEYLRHSLDSLEKRPAGKLESNVINFITSLNFNDIILPNLFYDEVLSNRMKESMLANISKARGMVQAGERIISKGDLVTDNTFLILESLKQETEIKFREENISYIWLGQSILIFITFLGLYIFLKNFSKAVLLNIRKTSFVLFILLLFISISLLVLGNETINFYIIPFAIVPIVMRTFYDDRLALFVHTIGLLIIGLIAPNGFEFVFMNFIVGIIAIFSLTKIYYRSKLIYSALIISFTYSLLFIGLDLIKERSFLGLNWINLAWFWGNGLLVLTCYPLIYFFEKTFGFISDATLVELSDTNQPVLRKLAEEAPGTFQHSIQVANLAEAAAIRIGGNPLLVRAGALYHDIGKMTNPQYFIENLQTGINPHDQLLAGESTKIIINHVAMGVEIAKKSKLPQQIIDFILTHHGNTRMQYFYKTYLTKYPNEAVELDQFIYPGPKPFSKETAVVMMADSVEAASRSLREPNEEKIDQLVESIINYQVVEDQFAEANITFKDITTIKEIFKNKLKNIYHIRLAYPA